MMTEQDVLEIVCVLEARGISVWLDGGWGVDALLGTQRRRHKDLDVSRRSSHCTSGSASRSLEHIRIA